jgi:hypothetical protein
MNLSSTEKIQEYANLQNRSNKITEKWIFIDFDLIQPQKLSGYEDIKNWNSYFLSLASAATNISKTFVTFDEFRKNPDKYILLIEYLANKDWRTLLYKQKDCKGFWNKLLYNKKFRKCLNNVCPILLPSKQIYEDSENLSNLIEYLVENDIALDLLNPITWEKHL